MKDTVLKIIAYFVANSGDNLQVLLLGLLKNQAESNSTKKEIEDLLAKVTNKA